VPAGQIGVLMADLDCGLPTGEPSYGVALENRAALDLNGHTITGPRYAVYCPAICRIIGPGTITGAYYGIWALDSKRGRADVFSRPRLTASTCGASAGLVESDPPWGVSAND
jgi:hypothetical protein